MKYLIQKITVKDTDLGPSIALIETIDVIGGEETDARNYVRNYAFSRLEPFPGRTMLWIQHGGSVTVGKVSTANMEFPVKRSTQEYYSITELIEPKG